MTNRKMRNSIAYKTYLAFATGAATRKKVRKFKKRSSRSKKKTLVVVEEPAEKPAKKPAARRQYVGVQIRDTPGVSVSKKKTSVKAERSKGIELLSEAALLEEAQLKKAIKQKNQETNFHQGGSSSVGADLESEVPDEPKGKSIDTSEGTGLKLGVPDVSKADSSESEYESWGDNDDDDQQSDDERTESDDEKSVDLKKTDDEEETQDDEFAHTLEDYVPTDDEIDDLRDAKLEGEGKDDKEMTDTGHVEAEHKNINQEVACDQVKDDAQATVTAAPATQKTEVPLQSSFISSDYATKFLNFDNIPSADTEIILMMDIKVQHEDPSIHTSPLLTVPVTVILKSSTAPATTIPLPIPPFILLQQQSTPIRTPKTTEATISTTSASDFSTLTAFHQRLSDLENEVNTLRNVDHSSAIRATIKSKVPTVVKEYIGTNLDDTLHKVIQRHTTELIKEHSVLADVVEVLQQQ
ncbi:hypothetical protein Tco_1338803 [Tanacetum coccineum]